MNNSNNRFTPKMLSSAIAAVALSVPYNAAIAENASTQEVRILEEIIVSARKREESLQETPVVISALSAKSIKNFSIDSVEDISDFTPGLIADTQGNPAGGILFLRGVGSGSASPSIDQAVSLVIDDMQVGSLNIQNTAMIDMEAVQVYKGPQALFFGKNSPGGVLSIRSADPGEEFEAQVKTGYEFEADEWFVQGMVSGPISDAAAGRLVVRYTESDGYFDVESGPFSNSLGDKATPDESIFARGTLVLSPSDNLNVRAKLIYSDREAPTDGRINVQRTFCPQGTPQNSLPFNCDINKTVFHVDIPQGAIDAFDTIGISMDPTGKWDNEQVLVTVALGYDINDSLSFTSVTGYYDLSDFQNASGTFGLFEPFLSPAQAIEFDQFTQEIRLATNLDGPVNFVTGLYYEEKEHNSSTPVAANFGVLGGLGFDFWGIASTEYKQNTEAMSGFVDVTWDITEKLELSGGARYSWEEKEFIGIAGYLGSETEDWDDVSPQVTLSYQLNNEWMLFASYREGFKSGGFDGAFQFAPTTPRAYEPESVEGFELGAKGTLLDNTLQLNAAIFSYEYDELQLGLFDPDTISLFTVNAAEAETTGLEMDFVWVTPVDGLQARGAIAYLDSEFKEFLAPCYTGQAIDQGCNQDFGPTPAFAAAGFTEGFRAQDLGGQSLVLAADHVVNLGLSYDVNLDNFLLGLTLDAVYSDDYETGVLMAPETRQDSHTKVNASIRLSGIDESWSVALIGRNLTDELTIADGGSINGTGGLEGTPGAFLGDSGAFVRPGRTVAVQFEYNF